MRYAACVEYDGSNFNGWQAQKHNVRTVQSTVEVALSKVADCPTRVVTAGRTDSGVHATHQVIHFDSHALRSTASWCRGTNRFMDADVRLRWVQEVSEEFHARFAALSRSYRFIIYNHPLKSALYHRLSTHEARPLNPLSMAAAGAELLGEHDFSSFRAAGCQAHTALRNIQNFKLSNSGPWIWFDITANAFLQHMVRNIAGALIEIGCAKREPQWMQQVLKARDRTVSGITASPNGLYLVGVEYPAEFALPTNKQAVALWCD
ncbi:MAG: tRNA pseudouridine(38-40) synthase TruA [Gammaproteobacteria bacterium]|nr:tRNA pseudouridine(38-40) synthase TruA [Gammaproteobacteria bacterium]